MYRHTDSGGVISWAYSQRSHKRGLYRRIINDPVSGIYLFPGEEDKPSYKKNPKILDDHIELEHPLPDNLSGTRRLHIYNEPLLGLHLSQADLELQYERRFQHPERHFYMWKVASSDITTNITTDDPCTTIANAVCTETGEYDRSVVLPFGIAQSDPDVFYNVIAYHNSWIASGIELGDNNHINQYSTFGLATGRGRFHDEDYHMLISKNAWTKAKILDGNTPFFNTIRLDFHDNIPQGQFNG